MSHRSRYRAERSRSQRDGGIAMAMYRMEERDKRRAENNRISKRVAREVRAIGRGAAGLLVGKSRTPRKRRR
jgi:hypothetical protein